jgi:hypothetical protein
LWQDIINKAATGKSLFIRENTGKFRSFLVSFSDKSAYDFVMPVLSGNARRNSAENYRELSGIIRDFFGINRQSEPSLFLASYNQIF